MSNPVTVVLPHFLFVFVVSTALFGCYWLGTIICTGLAIALYKYKLPQCPRSAEEFLSSQNTPIIAHRGAGRDAPENTLGAIRLAKQNGATAIEFDVDYTTDGVAVVIHDATVDRTTDGTGKVTDLRLDAIQQLNAAAKHPNREKFPEERVPTLDETIKLCLDLGLKMFIDVKGSAKLTAVKITEMFQKFPTLYKNAAVCSFHPQIVYMVKQADRAIMTGLTHRQHYISGEGDGSWRVGPAWYKLVTPTLDILLRWAHYHWLWFLCGSDFFLIWNRDISQNVCRHFKQCGVQCVVWTVNDPVEKVYMKDVLKVPYMTDTLM